MRAMGWLLLLTCVACGDAALPLQEDAWSIDSRQPEAMTLAPTHNFNIKSAAFDVTENGLTRSFTLVVSDQNDVCQDLLAGVRHRNEHRLALVGITGGSTPLTGQFTMMQGRSIPKLGAAMLMVPAFLQLNQRCSNTAPHIISGAMTVFRVDSKQANAAFGLQPSDGGTGGLSGAVVAKFCQGIRDSRKATSYRTCVE